MSTGVYCRDGELQTLSEKIQTLPFTAWFLVPQTQLDSKTQEQRVGVTCSVPGKQEKNHSPRI
jgi:hypothetical protein